MKANKPLVSGIAIRTYLCEYAAMNGHEFERKIKGIGRQRGVPVFFDSGRGKGSRPMPRSSAGHSGPGRAVLPSLVTAKLAVYETLRTHGWSKLRLAKELGMSENSVRRLLDLRHSSQMWIIDEALSKMNSELAIDLPKPRPRKRAA
jgi:hypothetical protein